MNTVWLFLIGAAALAVAYAFARPWLHDVSWLKPFYDWVEPLERTLWQKSRTILLARLVTILSLVVGVHDAVIPLLTAVDWTPFVPEQYQRFVPLLGAAIGPAFEWLRRITAPLPAAPDQG